MPAHPSDPLLFFLFFFQPLLSAGKAAGKPQLNGSKRSHWIVTVKLMEDTGEPLLPVAVSTALVLPVVPVVVVVVVLELVLLPPPHAESIVNRTKAVSAKAVFQRISLWYELRNRIAKRIPSPAIIALPIAHLLVSPGRADGLIMLAVVVLTVTVTGIPAVGEVEEVKVTEELGLKLHVAAVGRLEHAKVTVPVYPFTG